MEATERRRTILRPSVSHQEYGTAVDWMECVEIATAKIYGTTGPMQREWMDTLLEVPPKESTIFAGADLPSLSRAAA